MVEDTQQSNAAVRAILERSAVYMAQLRIVTGALVKALSPEEVAATVIEQVIPTIGAYGGGLLLRSPDSSEHYSAYVTDGSYQANIIERWQRFRLDEHAPAADALRLGEPIWLGSREDWLQRYPDNAAEQAVSQSQAIAALPLMSESRTIGVLGMSFATPQAFDMAERLFLQTIALQCAHALERARLYAAEHAALTRAEEQQRRLRLLSDASITLARSLDYQETLVRVVRLMLPALGDWCMLDLADEQGEVRRVAGAHADPAKDAIAQQLTRFTPDANARNPVVASLADGKVRRVNGVTDAMLVAAAQSDAHLELVRSLAPIAFMVVPLQVQGRILGALTYAMAESGRAYGEDDEALAVEVARRAARSIAHAQTHRQMQEEIARRKLAEETLSWQAGLLDQSFDAIIVWEYDGPISFWNRGAEQLYGFSRQEAIGRSPHELLQTRPPEALAAFHAALAEDGHWQGELQHIGKGGQQITVESRLVMMRQESSRRYVLESNRDISARKEAEEHRLVLDRKLQDVQRMESLGLLAGGIAHDFNNLLVAILGNAELALMDLAPEAPARAGIAQISAAARRAADLTRQLLAYAGRGQLVVQPIQLNVLIEEMLHLLRAAIVKNVLLHFAPAASLPMVVADATQLRQVLMNLVVNASEAIGTRSGVILVSTGTMWADHAYLEGTLPGSDIPEGDYAFIEVADSGEGMDAATEARIFEPFFSTKFAGRGLGLAATLGIMRGHKGAIKVYSEPGRGTTFKLLLPITQTGERQERDAAADDDAWRGSGTVLIVEDELEVRTIVGRTLERLGFTTLTAEDGRAGVELFRQRAGELVCVLLDMTMPHMSGAESFRLIRQIRADVPVILMSGYSEQDTIMRFAGKGIAGFLQKPFRPQQLAALLQQILGE